MAYKYTSKANKLVDNALVRLQAALNSKQEIWSIEHVEGVWSVSVRKDPKLTSPDDTDGSIQVFAHGRSANLYDAISLCTVDVIKYNAKHVKRGKKK